MLEELKKNNQRWAASKTAADPAVFNRLVGQQTPNYLWIGCADSRVPGAEAVGLDLGDIFFHRNVGNQAPTDDLNFRAVLQYAVQVLQVKHILVVGHYGCGAVGAAMEKPRLGLVDDWIRPVRELFDQHSADLAEIDDSRARHDRLCELNVVRQVASLASDPFVREAWARGQKLSVHGWIYAIATGLVRDLEVTVSGPGDPPPASAGSPDHPRT